jgi:hypothetical protein
VEDYGVGSENRGVGVCSICQCLCNLTFHFWEVAICVVMNITYSRVPLATGCVFPACGTDLLAFFPCTPFESQNNNNRKSNNPSEPLLHLKKCFRLVSLAFVLWVVFTPSILWLWMLQQEIKWSRPESLLAEMIALDFPC